MHFVTSTQPDDHVTDDNAAHLNAGIVGNGKYVLPVRNRFAATLTDTNTLRILGGDASICGRHVSIDDEYEEVSIENGTPGMNREDLAVIHVELDPDPICELRVYRGEETTGAPVVPGYIDGDLNDGDTVTEMPICSVRIEGINPQEPVSLLRELVTLDALKAECDDRWDSLSQPQKLSGLVPEVEGYIVGAVLVVIVAGFHSGSSGNKLTKVLQSPRRIARYAVQTIAPMDGTYSYIEAHVDGTVNVRTNSAESVYGILAVPLATSS